MNLFENLEKQIIECDSSKLLLFLEAVFAWKEGNKDSLTLFNMWYRNKPLQNLMKECQVSKIVRGYITQNDISENIKEDTTFKLDTGKVVEWYKDKNFAIDESEKLVLAGVYDRTLVGTHLIPVKDIIFDFECLDYLREFGSSLGKGLYGQPLKELLDKNWETKGSPILVNGDINRCQVQKIHSLSADKNSIKEDILGEIKKQLERL